jgi:hypothetical protein
MAAGLTEFEKWSFDHHGYLVLEAVVRGAELEHLRATAARWHAALPAEFRGGPAAVEGLPLPLQGFRHPSGHPQFIANVQYGDPGFAALALNVSVMRVVQGLTSGQCTLVGSDLVQMRREGGALNEGPFHGEIGEQVGGSVVPGRQWKDYHVTDAGEIRVGFVNCGVSLVDVPSGMGFACIPGSHKRNFRPPDNLEEHYPAEQVLRGPGVPSVDKTMGPPTVANLAVRAGDCICFTEALRHAILRWDAPHPRLTVFNRYKASWGRASFDDLKEHAHRLPPALLRLQAPSGLRPTVWDGPRL